MGYYSYKHVRNSIPDSFKEEREKRLKEEYGEDYEPDYGADYDGGLWLLASDYIDYLHEEIKKLKGQTK